MAAQATVLHVVLRFNGAIDDFDDATQAAVALWLRALLGCWWPVCDVALYVFAGSVVVDATVTVLEDDQEKHDDDDDDDDDDDATSADPASSPGAPPTRGVSEAVTLAAAALSNASDAEVAETSSQLANLTGLPDLEVLAAPTVQVQTNITVMIVVAPPPPPDAPPLPPLAPPPLAPPPTPPMPPLPAPPPTPRPLPSSPSPADGLGADEDSDSSLPMTVIAAAVAGAVGLLACVAVACAWWRCRHGKRWHKSNTNHPNLDRISGGRGPKQPAAGSKGKVVKDNPLVALAVSQHDAPDKPRNSAGRRGSRGSRGHATAPPQLHATQHLDETSARSSRTASWASRAGRTSGRGSSGSAESVVLAKPLDGSPCFARSRLTEQARFEAVPREDDDDAAAEVEVEAAPAVAEAAAPTAEPQAPTAGETAGLPHRKTLPEPKVQRRRSARESRRRSGLACDAVPPTADAADIALEMSQQGDDERSRVHRVQPTICREPSQVATSFDEALALERSDTSGYLGARVEDGPSQSHADDGTHAPRGEGHGAAASETRPRGRSALGHMLSYQI